MIWNGVLSWLGDALDAILCVLMQIPYFVLWAIISGVNALVIAIAALVGEMIDLLPAMPELPGIPEPVEVGLGWIAWLWPVNTTLDILVFFLAFALVWLAVSIALRWAKAV